MAIVNRISSARKRNIYPGRGLKTPPRLLLLLVVGRGAGVLVRRADRAAESCNQLFRRLSERAVRFQLEVFLQRLDGAGRGDDLSAGIRSSFGREIQPILIVSVGIGRIGRDGLLEFI